MTRSGARVDGAQPLAVALTADEKQALSLAQALGPFEITDELARRLGFEDASQLERESDRLTDLIRAEQPLTYAEWKSMVHGVHALMSPGDSEWQTVTGLEYEENAVLIATANRKIDHAFGGTILNPAPGATRP